MEKRSSKGDLSRLTAPSFFPYGFKLPQRKILKISKRAIGDFVYQKDSSGRLVCYSIPALSYKRRNIESEFKGSISKAESSGFYFEDYQI